MKDPPNRVGFLLPGEKDGNNRESQKLCDRSTLGSNVWIYGIKKIEDEKIEMISSKINSSDGYLSIVIFYREIKE